MGFLCGNAAIDVRAMLGGRVTRFCRGSAKVFQQIDTDSTCASAGVAARIHLPDQGVHVLLLPLADLMQGVP